MKESNKPICQTDIVLNHLNIRGRATTSELNNLGVMAPAARIFTLKRAGWPIGKVMFDKPDHNGIMHRQAQYYLRTEITTPEQQQVLKEILQDL